MSVITLTSDWNKNDYYVSAVKGSILSRNEKARIADISHTIKVYNSTEAAYLIRRSYLWFPAGSVHLNFVNSEPGPDQKFLLVESAGHFFIGTDSGFFSLMLDENADKIIELTILEQGNEKRFPGIRTFTSAACDLIEGKAPEELGDSVDSFHEKMPIRATVNENIISGSVIYTDSYGNAITNIPENLFVRMGKERDFKVFVQSKHYVVHKISSAYNEVPEGNLVAVINSAGLLEIAIRAGNAKKLLNLGNNSTIRVEFDH